VTPTIDPATGLPKAWTYGLGGAQGASLLNPSGLGSNQLGRSTPGAGAGLGGGYNPVSGAGTGGVGPTTIHFGGGAPTPTDYANQILNDPAFKQLRDSLSAQGISDAAHLRGAIQQALIQFGAVPDLPQDVLSSTGLDTGATATLAANNPFSTLKQLQQNYQNQQDASRNQLAARGILSSGETGYQAGQLGQANALGNYNATNTLLGGIGTLNDQYVAGQRAALAQLNQGAFQAEANAAANGPVSGAPTVTANWNPSTGTYVDGSGNHYDVNGNPIALPPATPPPGAFSGSGSGGLAPAPTPPTQYVPGQKLTSGVAYAQ
jgi:hypothetical protein